jgi:hypothetical protein
MNERLISENHVEVLSFVSASFPFMPILLYNNHSFLFMQSLSMASTRPAHSRELASNVLTD